MNTREVQAALLSLGFDPGPVDGQPGMETTAAVKAFQIAAALLADGVVGPNTVKALQASIVERGERRTVTGRPASGGNIPVDWLSAARMLRVIVHWTAGSHRASKLDRSHYHILIEGDATLVRGIPSIALNDASGTSAGYAAHTLNCNTGSIGVSLCCMGGAVENPFRSGSSPMTPEQWAILPKVLADLCRRYDIAATPKTLLSHAEVQGTLGIKQRGKWDISRLSFDATVVGATACGNAMRSAVLACL